MSRSGSVALILLTQHACLRTRTGWKGSIGGATTEKNAARRSVRWKVEYSLSSSPIDQTRSELFLPGEHMTTKRPPIVKARLGADGKLRRVAQSGRTSRAVPGRINEKLLDSPAAFEPDTDTPVLTRRELRELRPAAVDKTPDVAAIRRRLRMSQGAFAALFGIPLATVKDWEQGRRSPDAPSCAYLRVITENPKAVRAALKTAAE